MAHETSEFHWNNEPQRLPEDVLRASPLTQTPSWLRDASRLTPTIFQAFLSSRVVFYPGAGEDGQPMRIFNSSRSACCFVYADYGGTPRSVAAGLREPHRIRGYQTTSTQELSPEECSDLFGADLTHHPWGGPEPAQCLSGAVWTVLERKAGFGPDHGMKNLGFLYVTGEALWTYWAIWHARNSAGPWFAPRPHAIVLQDHGWGGNWTRFGGHDSPLLDLADALQAMPDWLLVSTNTTEWPGFEVASELSWNDGGMHGFRRKLYRRTGFRYDRATF